MNHAIGLRNHGRLNLIWKELVLSNVLIHLDDIGMTICEIFIGVNASLKLAKTLISAPQSRVYVESSMIELYGFLALRLPFTNLS